MMTQDLRNTATSSPRVPGRDLVVVTAAPTGMAAFGDRPLAGFLAQLIACGRRLPAYRTNGRASPVDATRTYSRDDAPLPVPGRLDRMV